MHRLVNAVTSRQVCALLVLLAVLGPAPRTAAQGHVTLGEILPALEGTELGALEVADAPPPGGVRVVRRDEVRDALEAAGRSAEGLDIPARSRIEREGVELDGAALAALAHDAVAAAVMPCTLDELLVRVGVTVPAGARTLEVVVPDRVDSGGLAFTLRLTVDGLVTRVSAQAELTCPAPVVEPGRVVTVRVRAGAVTVTAHGVAREAGRVGDVVRVRVDETGALLEGHVLDGSTVEVAL